MVWFVLALSTWLAAPVAVDADYEKDVEFALEELEKRCGHFFDLKDIDWKKVSKEFRKAAKDVESHQDHFTLLVRLLARLEDGHARVEPADSAGELQWPVDQSEWTGPGMFLTWVGKKLYIKNAWSGAAGSGLEPGMEIVKVDGTAARKWFDAKVEEVCEYRSFSTDHQARFFTCHWGLAAAPGTRLELEIKDNKGKKKKRTITYTKASVVAHGPAVFPSGLESSADLNYGVLESGYGYVHVRRCKGSVVDQMDAALAKLGNVPGIILDFRGNSGGGFDHDALYNRFIPEGERFGKWSGAGPNPYGGPMVVIVDATVRSAGETGSGMFKEDGRGYMIGESPTAGMSASKERFELPSGLFSLYVSVFSNKKRFQGGRGIEGIGIEPHELVEFKQKDLAAGRDTLIEQAQELLRKFPQKDVPYDPAKHGWSSRQ